MAESFDIVLSKTLTPADVATALAQLLPPGVRIDIKQDMSELPDEPGDIWSLVASTEDCHWPCVFNCLVCSDKCELGPYPDLRIAAWLYRYLGADSLCSTHNLIEGLDPHDPYWFLACFGGQWYLADAGNTALMGPYTDGIYTFPGSKKVQMVRALDLPNDLLA